MDYNIHFKTSADLKAAQDLLKNTKEQTAAAKELKAAVDAVGSTRSRVEANIAASRAGREGSSFDDKSGAADARIQRRLAAQKAETAATLDATAATDKFGLSNRQAGDALKKLSHEIPGLGVLISALKNPYIGAAAAVAGMIAGIKALIEEQNKMADSANSNITALDATVGPLGAVRDIANEAAAAERELAEALAKIKEDAGRAGVALGKEKTEIEDRLRIKKEEIELEKKLALARLETARAGGLDEAEYARRKGAIEGKSEKEIAAAVAQAQNNQGNAIAAAAFKEQERAAAAQKRIPGLRAALAGKQQQLAEALRFEDAASIQRDQQEKELQAEAEAARKDIAGITADDLNYGSLERRKGLRQKLSAAEDRLKGAEGGLAGIRTSRREAGEGIGDLRAGVTEAAGKVKGAEGQLTDSTKAADDLLQQFIEQQKGVSRQKEADNFRKIVQATGEITAAAENQVETVIQLLTGIRVRVDTVTAKIDAAARSDR